MKLAFALIISTLATSAAFAGTGKVTQVRLDNGLFVFIDHKPYEICLNLADSGRSTIVTLATAAKVHNLTVNFGTRKHSESKTPTCISSIAL